MSRVRLHLLWLRRRGTLFGCVRELAQSRAGMAVKAGTRLPPVWAWFDSRLHSTSGLSLWVLLSAPKGFFPGFSDFPLPIKLFYFTLFCLIV